MLQICKHSAIIIIKKSWLIPTTLKAHSDGARKTHQPGLFIYAYEKRTQIEKILSTTAFYAANYAGLNEPLGRLTRL